MRLALLVTQDLRVRLVPLDRLALLVTQDLRVQQDQQAQLVTLQQCPGLLAQRAQRVQLELTVRLVPQVQQVRQVRLARQVQE